MSSRERRDEKRCTSQRFLLILYQSKGCINYVRESHPCLSEPPHVSLPLCPSEGTSSIVTFGEERLKRKHCPSLSFLPSFCPHSHSPLSISRRTSRGTQHPSPSFSSPGASRSWCCQSQCCQKMPSVLHVAVKEF